MRVLANGASGNAALLPGDAEWLADLLRHGLLRARFIPPAPIRELRELTRYRKTLVHARTDEVNRLHKTLEGANLKLAAVDTDVLGVSGWALLEALLTGEQDRVVLAELARRKLRPPSCRRCGRLWRVASSRTIACCSVNSWRTSPTWKRASPRDSRPSSRA